MTMNADLFLRRTLQIDAAATGVTAVMLVAAAAALETPLGLPAALLRGAGLVLLPYTAFLVLTLRSAKPSRAAVWFTIAANALWALDSVLLLFSGWVQPTLLGEAFVVAQAVVVAVFAEAQYVALRRNQLPAAKPAASEA